MFAVAGGSFSRSIQFYSCHHASTSLASFGSVKRNAKPMLIRNIFASVVLAASAVLIWIVFFDASLPTATTPVATDVIEEQAAESYAQRDWDRELSGSMNISLFTFRDMDRSGRYDVGDLPMSAVVVDLVRPDGSEVQTASNINGFANFKMSLDNPEYPVNQAEQLYDFRVQIPPGWEISSGNPEQHIFFTALRGSVAGLVAKEPPRWVGLVPVLTITGRLVMAQEQPLPEDLQVFLVDPRGDARAITVGDDGGLRASVSPGRWQLRAESAALSWQYERDIPVAAAPVAMPDITVGEAQLPALPNLLVENFDWLQRSTIDKIPNGHLSLDWDYLLATDNQLYGGPGYVNGLVSGHAVAYNSSGHPVTIASVPPEVFDFVGGYFSVAWPNAQGEELQVVAWRGEQEVARYALALSYLGPVWLDADLRGIDRLSLSTRHYWQFVADDLQFRMASGQGGL